MNTQKTGFRQSILKSVVIVLAAFALGGCIFDRGPCDDSHSSVTRMRALSDDQLARLYNRVMGLREEYAYEQMLQGGDTPIPDDLAYLKAMRIWFRGPSDDVQVTLTKCNVSVGINLEFRNGDYGPKRIALNWSKPTNENPYKQDSEVLWSE